MTDDKYGYGNIIIINIRERISNDVSIVARRFAWGYTPCIRLLRRQNRNENILFFGFHRHRRWFSYLFP